MLLPANGLLSNEVLLWKAIGAAVWLAAIAACADAFWSLTLAPASLLSPLRLLGAALSPSAWLASAALVLAQAPAFAAQAGMLTTAERRPRYSARLLHWPRLASAAAVLAKLAARADIVAGAARVAAFYGLHVLSAVLCLSLFPAGRGLPLPGAGWTLQYALWLAGGFLLHWAFWSGDVLLFPSVQRHRWFRIKQRLPAAAAQAAKLAAAAFVCAAATAVLRGNASAAAGGDSASESASSGAPPLTLGGAAAALLAGSLCAFCWLASGEVLEAVFTERLRPDDYSDRDVLGAMAASLAGKKGDLMQGLALQDASLLASDVGKAALRRADIFADESGDRWKPVAAACMAELDALSAAVAAAAAQQKPAAGAGRGALSAAGASQSQHRWNVLPSALSSKGGLGGSKPQVDALLAARYGYPRAVLAARGLAGFACASLAEDRFGVLQLTKPGLGDVLLCLLSALGAAQQLMRAAASLATRHLSLGPWRSTADGAPSASAYSSQPLDAAAFALADVLTVCLYRLAATFGDGLTKVLAEASSTPAYGSTAEAAALLQQVLRGQA